MRFTRSLGLLLIAAGAAVSTARAGDDAVKAAREAFKLLNENNHKEFIAHCAAQMSAAMTETQAAQLREMLKMRFGDYQSEISAEATPKANYQSVMMKLQYSKGVASLELLIDTDNKLAGLWIRGFESSDAAALPSYAKPDTYAEEAVVVKTGKYELPGTLTLPKSKEKCAAVVLVHGSGPHDQDETIIDNKPFRDLALGLASRGIAVLRYEKRTHKYGAEMNVAEIGLDEETNDDALSAVALLRARADVDAKRIFVLGHSLGGIAAPFIAQRDPQIAGIVLLAGTPRPLLDIVEEQIEYIAKLDDKVDDAESKQLEALRETKAKIRDGTFDPAKDTLLGAPAAYWKKIDALRAGDAAAKLTCRILVIQGGRDYQVDKKSFEGWKSALAGRQNATFRLFDKLNHLMMAGEGPSGPMEYQKKGFVDAAVVNTIADWVLKGK